KIVEEIKSIENHKRLLAVPCFPICESNTVLNLEVAFAYRHILRSPTHCERRVTAGSMRATRRAAIAHAPRVVTKIRRAAPSRVPGPAGKKKKNGLGKSGESTIMEAIPKAIQIAATPAVCVTNSRTMLEDVAPTAIRMPMLRLVWAIVNETSENTPTA